MKKIWLVLFPDTFLWIKSSVGLLYNSKNYKHFIFHTSGGILKLINTLVDLDSLYSVELSETSLSDKHVEEWINKIICIEAGCRTEQDGHKREMVSYYPYLRIQNDIDQIIWDHKMNIGGGIIKNLHELVFYINGSLKGSDQYFKQTYYPIKSDASIDFNYIKSLVNMCMNMSLVKITFIGDFANYKDFEDLKKWILFNDYCAHLVLLAEDAEKNKNNIELLGYDKISFTIIINNHLSLSKQLEIYHDFSNRVTFVLPVTSNEELRSILSVVQETGIKNYRIIPIYNGINKDFFEDNVYMTIDEFNDIKLSKREIFTNMTLNVHFFGKLTVMPEGEIYSNVNDSPLGSIGKPIYDLIYKEMTERKTWFRVRDMKPCCDCVYQWLCPSPGNYEMVTGKPDLCHITV